MSLHEITCFISPNRARNGVNLQGILAIAMCFEALPFVVSTVAFPEGGVRADRCWLSLKGVVLLALMCS